LSRRTTRRTSQRMTCRLNRGPTCRMQMPATGNSLFGTLPRVLCGSLNRVMYEALHTAASPARMRTPVQRLRAFPYAATMPGSTNAGTPKKRNTKKPRMMQRDPLKPGNDARQARSNGILPKARASQIPPANQVHEPHLVPERARWLPTARSRT
jgi:hypothetical protein